MRLAVALAGMLPVIPGAGVVDQAHPGRQRGLRCGRPRRNVPFQRLRPIVGRRGHYVSVHKALGRITHAEDAVLTCRLSLKTSWLLYPTIYSLELCL